MMTLDLSCRDMDRLIGISRTFQGELPKDWLLSEPDLAKDLQTLFGADFIGSDRWDEVTGQFRDPMCIGRDPAMAADYEKEFQFCDPITPLARRTGGPTLVRQLIDESVTHTRFWNEHRLHHDTVDGLELHMSASGKEVGDLRLWRGKASPPFGDRERNMLRLLEPVLAGFFQRLRRQDPPNIEDRFPELTPREAQVASAVASGASDYVISRRLGISIWTVRTHLRHVFAKLDVPNRTVLAGLLNRLELTAEPDHDAGQ
jgi:DNA-binding CsgD family transcriptional regulator